MHDGRAPSQREGLSDGLSADREAGEQRGHERRKQYGVEVKRLVQLPHDHRRGRAAHDAADVADELSRLMRAYPRDLTPYLAEWVSATMRGEKAAIEPKTYPSRNKMTIALTAILSAAVTTGVCLLLSNF